MLVDSLHISESKALELIQKFGSVREALEHFEK